MTEAGGISIFRRNQN